MELTVFLQQSFRGAGSERDVQLMDYLSPGGRGRSEAAGEEGLKLYGV